jgi:hypothetical protein
MSQGCEAGVPDLASLVGDDKGPGSKPYSVRAISSFMISLVPP